MSIQHTLDSKLDQQMLQAGSLITTLLGDAVLPRGGKIWLGSLIQLLLPFGLNERQIRTAVFRLAKEEWLSNEVHGRRSDYALTTVGRHRFEKAAQQIYAAHSPLWDQQWRLIMVVGTLTTKEREYLKKTLFWQGFGKIGSDAFIHPSAELNTALDSLISDGMAPLMSALMPLIATDARLHLSISNKALVDTAWDLDKLAKSYQTFIHAYQPVLAELQQSHTIPAQQAFMLRTLLIHDYRRLLLRDPQLPDALLPQDWPGHQARLLCKEVYLRLQAPSEAYLDEHMRLANGDTPTMLSLLQQRFQGAAALLPYTG
ncbi:MAG: phenylacetic acid degradation operon negative regulatory protein PaaX [Neisseriaceae bacterium]|nr:phenylacetic acid degradation operon negative regulatory protein PaaX [Neisseriaceae bacterium]